MIYLILCEYINILRDIISSLLVVYEKYKIVMITMIVKRIKTLKNLSRFTLYVRLIYIPIM